MSMSDYLNPIGGLAQTGLIGTAATAAARRGAQGAVLNNANVATKTAWSAFSNSTDDVAAAAAKTLKTAENTGAATKETFKNSWSRQITKWFKKPFQAFGSWAKGLANYSDDLARAAGAGRTYISTVATRAGSTLASWGSSALKFLGGVPKLPIIGGAIEAVVQLPEVFQGFSEGRGAAALGNFGTRVAATAASGWAGFKAGALVGTSLGGPLGTFAGGAVGAVAGIAVGLVGSWLGGEVADGLFGTNKGDQVAVQQPFGHQTAGYRPGAGQPLTQQDISQIIALADDPLLSDPLMFT